MPYLLIAKNSRTVFPQLSEAGMDYYVVNAECVNYSLAGPFVIRSNGIAMPYRDPQNRFYDLVSLLEGIPFPEDSESVELTNISNIGQPLMLSTHLPIGYLPTRGAYPLIGTTILTHDTRFIRYTSAPIDTRYSASVLSAGTYLTSYKDSLLVNTGFGTVGRYALPLPVPAIFVHEYTLSQKSVLKVGTVAPNWGQSGGGVEVCTTTNTSVTFVNQPPNLDEY